jgi:hypothetical protein
MSVAAFFGVQGTFSESFYPRYRASGEPPEAILLQ